MNKKAPDYGLRIGKLKSGPLNKISDVNGVKVGHYTLDDGYNNTGVTVIMPTEKNVFINKLPCAAYVLNGFGKTAGTIQIEELGTLESPVALTSTLNVGLVTEGMVQYTLGRCKAEGEEVPTSVNSLVLECNDGRINHSDKRGVLPEDVFTAIENATSDFSEGDVGGGRGMICHGLKGGIGSSSRLVKLGDENYTVGVLVQTNYGALNDLIVNGKAVGGKIAKSISSDESEKGSVIVVVATDIPLSSRQLKRVIKRASVGLARCGSYIGHGSGEVFVGFSTAYSLKRDSKECFCDIRILNEDKMNGVFRAVAEATEEAVLNSMLCAEAKTAINGERIHSLAEYAHLFEQ